MGGGFEGFQAISHAMPGHPWLCVAPHSAHSPAASASSSGWWWWEVMSLLSQHQQLGAEQAPLRGEMGKCGSGGWHATGGGAALAHVSHTARACP